MPRIPGFSAFLLSVLLSLPAGAQGVPGGRTGAATPGLPPRDAGRRAVPTGTARITGRVLSADGTVLRRAQVTIMRANPGMRRITTTDAEGRYEFSDLPGGRFTLSASKSGYVTVQYRQRRPNEPGSQLNLSDGETRTQIDFALPRGGVITGRITDEFGEPIAGARVQALRFQYQPDGERRLGLGGGGLVQTDDLGQFRVYGLPPGDYVVSATVRTFGMVGPAAPVSDVNEGYPPTYYPGTLNQGEAQMVAVASAQETSLQFSLIPARLSTISGTIADSEGRPATGATVMFRSSDATGGGTIGSSTTMGPYGTFSIRNVAPGRHSIDVRISKPGGAMEFASVPLTTSGEDVAGLHIVTGRGGRISGRIMLEGDSGINTFNSSFRVFVQSAELSTPPGMMSVDPLSNGTVQRDGSFEVAGVSGSVLIRTSGPPTVAIKSVVVDGQDVTDVPIDIDGQESIDNVRIVLTDRLSDISGAVRISPQGERTKDYIVIVVPAEQKTGIAQTRYIRIARADSDGRFDMKGLPPEQYVAVAIADDAFENGEQFSPEFQDRVRRAGRSFSVSEGAHVSLDLTFTTGL